MIRRKHILAGGAAAALIFAATGVTAQTRTFNIPSQEASRSIPEFGRQAGVQITAPVSQLRGVRTPTVRGSLDARVALRQLLAGTSLEVASDTGEVITLRRASGPPAAALAQGDAGEPVGLDEVVVTAQKREERLLEAPVPVTAVSASRLVENNQVRLQDYFARIPGLTFTSGNRGEPFVAIRGITTTPFANPTVGIVVDDVPYGPTSLRGGGLIAPDVDPSELSRIEVLRGPQGTLYGVSSLGGLIKYVTVDPSTDGYSGFVQAAISRIRAGDNAGYSLRGAVNIPLGETLAVRLSGFTRSEPGYVDNVAAGDEDVNEGDAAGARLSALWRPSGAASLKFSALIQERDVEGSQLVFRQPTLGDLEQTYVRGAGYLRTNIQAYSLNGRFDLGAVTLTSLSGYNVNKIRDSVDTSVFFGAIANTRFGVRGAPITDHYKTKKFSQELRLAGALGERIEWLLGGFYTDERSRNTQDVLAVEPATGVLRGIIGHTSYPTTYREHAVFGDVTYRFTEQFDVQVGARQSKNRQTYSDTGPLFGGAPTAKVTIEDSPFTYLVTPRFKISPDLMVYGRFASGYRAGGINPVNPALPPGFDADTTENYEFGAKGALLERRVTFDASLYYIDWKDLQLNYLSPTGVGYQTNGSRARSRGAELSVEARPVETLSVTASASWNSSRLTEDFGAQSQVRGFDGDRLPFTPRFSGSLNLEKTFLVAGDAEGYVGGTATYVGKRVGLFTGGAGLRQTYPDYTQLDLRTGVRSGGWTLNAFVNNVTDTRGQLGGGLGGISAAAFVLTQPRTYGLSLSNSF